MNPFSDKVWGLVSGFPGRHRTERQLLMLQAYIDESGAGTEEGVFVMAGYIATAESWAERFVPEWSELLAMGPPNHAKIDAFKMSEMQKDMERCGWFYRVIEKNAIAGISVAIHIAGMRKAVREFPWPSQIHSTYLLENPYYFAFKAITDKLAQYQERLGINEPIDFVFDEKTHEKRFCIVAWDHLKKNSAPEFSKFMGDTPIFRPDSTTLPLQAADLYAWWVRKWENEGTDYGVYPPPFGWKHESTKYIPRFGWRFTEQDFIAEFQKINDPEVWARLMSQTDEEWGLQGNSAMIGA